MINSLKNRDSKFDNWSDYKSHINALNNSELWERVTVVKPTNNIGLEELWFTDTATNQVWVVIEPDPPYRGAWHIKT